MGTKVDSFDKASGLLNFKTGMSLKSWAGQEMSVMMIDNENGSVEVSVSGRRNQSGVVLQVYDWGEAAGIAKKVIAKMDEHLAGDDDNEEKVVYFKCPECSETLFYPAQDVGRKIYCSNCASPVFIPDPERKPNLNAVTNRKLRACPDCEVHVSRRATQCPHCGCPLDPD